MHNKVHRKKQSTSANNSPIVDMDTMEGDVLIREVSQSPRDSLLAMDVLFLLMHLCSTEQRRGIYVSGEPSTEIKMVMGEAAVASLASAACTRI